VIEEVRENARRPADLRERRLMLIRTLATQNWAVCASIGQHGQEPLDRPARAGDRNERHMPDARKAARLASRFR